MYDLIFPMIRNTEYQGSGILADVKIWLRQLLLYLKAHDDVEVVSKPSSLTDIEIVFTDVNPKSTWVDGRVRVSVPVAIEFFQILRLDLAIMHMRLCMEQNKKFEAQLKWAGF